MCSVTSLTTVIFYNGAGDFIHAPMPDKASGRCIWLGLRSHHRDPVGIVAILEDVIVSIEERLSGYARRIRARGERLRRVQNRNSESDNN